MPPTKIKPKRTIKFKKSRNPFAKQPWRFQIFAENGEQTGGGENYVSKQSAEEEAHNYANATWIIEA